VVAIKTDELIQATCRKTYSPFLEDLFVIK